jgi:hypothetical protein
MYGRESIQGERWIGLLIGVAAAKLEAVGYGLGGPVHAGLDTVALVGSGP